MHVRRSTDGDQLTAGTLTRPDTLVAPHASITSFTPIYARPGTPQRRLTPLAAALSARPPSAATTVRVCSSSCSDSRNRLRMINS